MLAGCAASDQSRLVTGSNPTVVAPDVNARCEDLAYERQVLAGTIKKHQDEAKRERDAAPDTLVRAFARWTGPDGAGIAANEKIAAAQNRSSVVTQAMTAKACPQTSDEIVPIIPAVQVAPPAPVAKKKPLPAS